MGASYTYAFAGRSRRDPTADAVLELINGAVTIGVHDAGSNVLLAKATVDALPFALGAQSLDLGTLALEPEVAVPQGYARVSAAPPSKHVPPRSVGLRNERANGWLRLLSHTHAQVLSGQLHGVRLWLTHRAPPPPLVVGGDGDPAAGSRPGTGASQRPKGSASKDASAAGGPYPPEESLPDPEPFSFIPDPAEAKVANVVELAVAGVEPLPPTLAAAVAAAQEGKAGGKVGFSCALRLPGGAPPVMLAGGALVAGGGEGGSGAGVAFQPAQRRQVLTGEQAAALLDWVDSGQPVQVEVAR